MSWLDVEEPPVFVAVVVAIVVLGLTITPAKFLVQCTEQSNRKKRNFSPFILTLFFHCALGSNQLKCSKHHIFVCLKMKYRI